MIDDVEILEQEPPNGPAIHTNLALVRRGMERAFVRMSGYFRAYAWTNENGKRILTRMYVDKIEARTEES